MGKMSGAGIAPLIRRLLNDFSNSINELMREIKTDIDKLFSLALPFPTLRVSLLKQLSPGCMSVSHCKVPRSATRCYRFTEMSSFPWIYSLLLWHVCWIRVCSSQKHPVPRISSPPFSLSCLFHYTTQFSSPRFVIALSWSIILALYTCLKLRHLLKRDT